MIQHPSFFVNILIVIGEGFWVLSIASQLNKIRKTRNSKGLHPITQTLNTAGNMAWATYFAINHLWFPFSTNVIMFVLSSITLGFILSHKRKFLQGLFSIAVIGPVTSLVLINNPSAGGWIGMSYNWIAGTPQLIRIIHRKKVSGISEHGIFFAFGAMFCVLAYGIIIHSYPLILGCLQGIIYESAVLYHFLKYRRED